MPSQGSDWFMAQLLPAVEGARYKREFFHPIHSLEHYDILSRCFGCELVSSSANLVRLARDDDFAACMSLWRSTHYNVAKEVWSAWQWPQFNQYFNTIFLYRNFGNTFPPARMRVIAWYEHLYGALEQGIDQQEGWVKDIFTEAKMLGCSTLFTKSAVAHFVSAKQLALGARRAGRTLIEWEKLLTYTEADLTGYLAACVPVNIDAEHIARNVVLSRRPAARSAEWASYWRDAERFWRALNARFPIHECQGTPLPGPYKKLAGRRATRANSLQVTYQRFVQS
jgi:hypothetical protein